MWQSEEKFGIRWPSTKFRLSILTFSKYIINDQYTFLNIKHSVSSKHRNLGHIYANFFHYFMVSNLHPLTVDPHIMKHLEYL